MSEPEPCPYDGAHEPGKPILCWSPGGPCEVPNAPGCETCGPCNHCDPAEQPKWTDLFGIDPTFDQPEPTADREGLAEVVMAASPGTPTLTALKIADALADLLAARDRRVRAEALREAQQVIAGEDTIEWARGAHSSYVSQSWAMGLLDDLLDDEADQ